MKTTSDFDAVVLANGDFPTHATPLAILHSAPYVVCCDGAANEYLSRGFRPDAIVGDGDSLSVEYRAAAAGFFHPAADQETNDQTKAIAFLRQRGVRRIAILGATGKREDHTLGNISLLMEYSRQGLEVSMVTDYGIFTPACGTRTFASHPGQQVSLFNFGATGLRSDGLIYPLSDFDRWWQGTLNESTQTQLTICATGYYLLFQTHDEGR